MPSPREWIARLNALKEARSVTPFEFGDFDCALWAAEGRAIRTGDDLGAPYRGTYKTAKGALRQLKRLDGVSSPVELADKRLGARLNVALARFGDVVAADPSLLDAEGASMGPALGLCFGAGSYFACAAGLIRLPTLSLEHCYHG